MASKPLPDNQDGDTYVYEILGILSRIHEWEIVIYRITDILVTLIWKDIVNNK